MCHYLLVSTEASHVFLSERHTPKKANETKRRGQETESRDSVDCADVECCPFAPEVTNMPLPGNEFLTAALRCQG